MTGLAHWLESHLDVLIQATVEALSQDAGQKAQVTETVAAFFESLENAVNVQDLAPLYERLHDWVAGRSVPIDDDLAGLVPVLILIEEVSSEQIRLLCPAEQAVELLIEMDAIFNQAISYLSRMETNALLMDMRLELAKAMAQLERLDKSKSDFVAVAAHELRTPITLIEGYANMLRGTDTPYKDDPVLAPLLDGMESGVKRLREIIRDMLDVSLITLDMIELHLQITWLPQLIDAVERSMMSHLKERNLELVIERDTIPRRPTYADPERLLQVLQKIVYNAIKYTPDGGRVIVTARELTGFTDIMVIDNGIGISANDLPHIFNMFSSLGDASLHSSGKTKFRGGGPGLGLYISKGVIEAHGGNIWAESPGFDDVLCPGSTFHVMIPMRSASSSDTINSTIFNNQNKEA